MHELIVKTKKINLPKYLKHYETQDGKYIWLFGDIHTQINSQNNCERCHNNEECYEFTQLVKKTSEMSLKFKKKIIFLLEDEPHNIFIKEDNFDSLSIVRNNARLWAHDYFKIHAMDIRIMNNSLPNYIFFFFSKLVHNKLTSDELNIQDKNIIFSKYKKVIRQISGDNMKRLYYIMVNYISPVNQQKINLVYKKIFGIDNTNNNFSKNDMMINELFLNCNDYIRNKITKFTVLKIQEILNSTTAETTETAETADNNSQEKLFLPYDQTCQKIIESHNYTTEILIDMVFIKFIFLRLSSLLMDIYTICNIMRWIYPPKNTSESSCKVIIIYQGESHAKNIHNFIENIPTIKETFEGVAQHTSAKNNRNKCIEMRNDQGTSIIKEFMLNL